MSITRKSLVATLFKWGSCSLVGHVILWELFVILPMFLFVLNRNYAEGLLTVSWAVRAAIVGMSLGVVGAMAFWYTVVYPLIRKKGNKC